MGPNPALGWLTCESGGSWILLRFRGLALPWERTITRGVKFAPSQSIITTSLGPGADGSPCNELRRGRHESILAITPMDTFPPPWRAFAQKSPTARTFPPRRGATTKNKKKLSPLPNRVRTRTCCRAPTAYATGTNGGEFPRQNYNVRPLGENGAPSSNHVHLSGGKRWPFVSRSAYLGGEARRGNGLSAFLPATIPVNTRRAGFTRIVPGTPIKSCGWRFALQTPTPPS